MRHLPNICCTQWPFGHLIVDDFGSKTYITQLYYSSEFVSKYHHQHEILKLIALTTVVFVHAFNLVAAKIALNTKLQPIKTIGGRWYFLLDSDNCCISWKSPWPLPSWHLCTTCVWAKPKPLQTMAGRRYHLTMDNNRLCKIRHTAFRSVNLLLQNTSLVWQLQIWASCSTAFSSLWDPKHTQVSKVWFWGCIYSGWERFLSTHAFRCQQCFIQVNWYLILWIYKTIPYFWAPLLNFFTHFYVSTKPFWGGGLGVSLSYYASDLWFCTEISWYNCKTMIQKSCSYKTKSANFLFKWAVFVELQHIYL